MRAFLYRDYTTEIELVDLPVPALADHQVLVEVEAAALNPRDVAMHSGATRDVFDVVFPYVVGSDLAGRVKAVGAGVSTRAVGDAIIGRCSPLAGGAFAEFAAIDEANCAALPNGIGMVEGAGVPTTAATAWHALFDAPGLRAGQKVLIHAAAGGVGSIAVQFAKIAGAYVVATASGEGVNLVAKLGADEVIDYRQADFAAQVRDVDLVLDTVGGETQDRSYGILRPGGHLASIVREPDQAMARSMGVRATRVSYRLAPGELEQLVRHIASSKIAVTIDSCFAIEEFDAAFARQATGRARGKVVVRMAERS